MAPYGTTRMNPKTFTGACSALQPLIALITRLVVGAEFIQTGFGKWQDIDKPIKLFTGLGIPMPTPSAYLVASVELIGGIALVLGAGTRIAALLLSTTMVVAILTAHRAQFLDLVQFGGTGLTDIAALVFLLLLLWLVACGPGPVSIDHPLSKRMTQKPKGK